MARMQRDVDVTPEIQIGNSVICWITAAPGTPPGFVRDGVIMLPPGGSFEISFHLQPGKVPGLQYNPGDAFCTDFNGCPALGTHNDGGQYSNPRVDNAGRTLVIDADPNAPRNAVHYRLNFTNGVSCDPIIING
jgi:hypothetical protein